MKNGFGLVSAKQTDMLQFETDELLFGMGLSSFLSPPTDDSKLDRF